MHFLNDLQEYLSLKWIFHWRLNLLSNFSILVINVPRTLPRSYIQEEDNRPDPRPLGSICPGSLESGVSARSNFERAARLNRNTRDAARLADVVFLPEDLAEERNGNIRCRGELIRN